MDNIWSKPNAMPESVQDRPTKVHEYLFLLSKSERYFYDKDSVMEPLTDSSIVRLAQDLEGQKGSSRANGGAKTNMKAVSGSKGAFGPEQSRERSGNINRKYSEDRGRPGSNMGANIPWEGERRNKRSVWTVATSQFTDAHFATFPEKLIEPCILAGTPPGGEVLDPFGGSGTVLKVAHQHGRECTIIELGPQYVEIAERRTEAVQQQIQFE